MTENDTATLWRSAARAWTGFRAVALAVVLTATVMAPTARAHARRPRHGRCSYAHTRIRAASRAALQASVVCLVNLQRAAHHLPPLRENQRLNRSAQGWTNVMVRHDDFSHGSDFTARISAVGFDWSMAAENIAAGFQTPAAVVRSWMASTGHCQNILSPSFADVGSGVNARAVPGFGAGGTWAQDFGLPIGARPPSSNFGPANGCPYG